VPIGNEMAAAAAVPRAPGLPRWVQFTAPSAATALLDALRDGGLSPAEAASTLRADGLKLSLALQPAQLVNAITAMARGGFSTQHILKVIVPDGVAVLPLDPGEAGS
jgi:hypothetical protein